MTRAQRKGRWRSLSRKRIHQTRMSIAGRHLRRRADRPCKTPLLDPIPSWVRTCHRYNLDVKWMRQVREKVAEVNRRYDNTNT
jgi:hypothetical protein